MTLSYSAWVRKLAVGISSIWPKFFAILTPLTRPKIKFHVYKMKNCVGFKDDVMIRTINLNSSKCLKLTNTTNAIKQKGKRVNLFKISGKLSDFKKIFNFKISKSNQSLQSAKSNVRQNINLFNFENQYLMLQKIFSDHVSQKHRLQGFGKWLFFDILRLELNIFWYYFKKVVLR